MNNRRGRGSLRASLVSTIMAMVLMITGCGGAAEETEETQPPESATTEAVAEEGTTTEEARATTTVAETELVEVDFLLPFLPSIIFYPVHLADELGYFAEEGLAVEVQPTEGSAFVVQQVAGGRSEIGTMAAEPVILGYNENPTYTVVYGLSTENTFDLYVLADSDITELADFDGRVIGVNDIVGGESLTARMLILDAGLALENVRIEAVGFDHAVQIESLTAGRIDGLMAAVDSRTSIELSDVEVRCITCEGQQLAGSSVIVSNPFLQENGHLIPGIGRALAKATVFGETNPEAALQIMSDVAPEQFANPEFARQLMLNALQHFAPGGEGEYGLVDVEAWENKVDLMLQPGAESGLDEPVDFQSLITNEFVEQYNDFDVSEIMEQAEQAPTYGG